MSLWCTRFKSVYLLTLRGGARALSSLLCPESRHAYCRSESIREGSKYIDVQASLTLYTECNKVCATEAGLLAHYSNSKQHNWCNFWQQDFESCDTLMEHRKSTRARCERCDTYFEGPIGRREHARQAHFFCVACDRFFQNQTNLAAVSDNSCTQRRLLHCSLSSPDSVPISPPRAPASRLRAASPQKRSLPGRPLWKTLRQEVRLS